jgi:hypothetical protein
MSYTGIKDQYGAVSKFREHLEKELREATGNRSLTVFQDNVRIQGGDKWEETLDAELASARLLLVLLSPTWLKSAWCRKEYRLFASGSSGSPTGRPVVPVIWQEISDEDAETEEQRKLLAELKSYQMFTWGDLRYEAWDSAAPNKAAGRLAVQLKPKLKKQL